jgi:glutaredoxin-related protein
MLTEETIKKAIKNNAIIVFVLPGCPYCNGLLELFETSKIKIKAYEVSQEVKPYVKSVLYDITKCNTFPQLFVDGKFKGGYSENNKKSIIEKYRQSKI